MASVLTKIAVAIGPGVLVAATGVGAGDLAIAGIVGSRFGVVLAWAIVVGAAMKFVLTEGVARHQIATGRSVTASAIGRGGRWAAIAFLVYLAVWSFLVGGALISACGVVASAIVPIIDDPQTSKVVLGAAHSAVGVVLVLVGGFKLFERLMAVCIALMFVTVLATAVMGGFQPGEMARGLVPRVPEGPGAMGQTLALIGGVGGTVTLLCYGYWIREVGRTEPRHLPTCRVDLGVGYLMTALFGLAMLVIAAPLAPMEGARGSAFIAGLANQLDTTLGPAARWLFLVGAWGAVFSSLVGVWQSIPYVLAETVQLARSPDAKPRVSERSAAYRAALCLLAVLPVVAAWTGFARIQLLYAFVGSLFVPMLAGVLLVINRRTPDHPRLANGPLTSTVLVAVLLFFGYQLLSPIGDLLRAGSAPTGAADASR